MWKTEAGHERTKLTVGDGFIGMLNVFVDPAGAAKRFRRRFRGFGL